MEIWDLIKSGLGKVVIQKCVEVYFISRSGSEKIPVGFFKNEEAANAFMRSHKYAGCFGARTAFLLTDGEIGFCIKTSAIVLDRELLTTEEMERLGN